MSLALLMHKLEIITYICQLFGHPLMEIFNEVKQARARYIGELVIVEEGHLKLRTRLFARQLQYLQRRIVKNKQLTVPGQIE